MTDTKKCPKCSGEMVECVFEEFPVAVRKLSSKLFEDKTADIIPYVCINCGYTEFYGKNPGSLT